MGKIEYDLKQIEADSAFIRELTDGYLEKIGGSLTADNLGELNVRQHTLLAYRIILDEVMEGDVKTSLMEPLIYTFKQKSFKFKGSKFALLDDVTNQVRSISGESVLHYRVWTLMVALLLIEMILFNPKLVNYKIPEKDKISLSPNKVIEQLQKDVE